MVADLAKTESLSSFDHGIKYLLCVTDVFAKDAWVKPLKDKEAKTVYHSFTEILSESKRKPSKLWVNQGK